MIFISIFLVQADAPSAAYSISGGGLPEGGYTLSQFHFHVGSDSTKGSEHTVNGMEYPLEVITTTTFIC